mgnify:CR=1 FL=1
MTNQVNEDMTTEMAEVSLPVVSLYTDNTEINELHGYTVEMDAAYMRDTITPIPQNRRLPVKITTYQRLIDGISYEIRSMDGKRLIEGSEITALKKTGDEIRFSIQLKDLIEENIYQCKNGKLALPKKDINAYLLVKEEIE